MLHPVEILPFQRATVRRSVKLGCELTTGLHGPRREMLVDLSPRGARVVTDIPLRPGDRVLVGFAPEGLERRVETIARVAHVSEDAIEKPSVGLEFDAIDATVMRELQVRLRNVPPPLPKPRRPEKELVWLDVLVTWEEDLGDRVNTYEVSEVLAAIDDGEMVVETLAPFLTGGRTAPKWIH